MPPGSNAGAPLIDFLRDEVVEVCGALALGGSLLRRLGLVSEAVRLERLFAAVEARLAEVQSEAAASVTSRSASSFVSGSGSYVSDSEFTQ